MSSRIFLLSPPILDFTPYTVLWLRWPDIYEQDVNFSRSSAMTGDAPIAPMGTRSRTRSGRLLYPLAALLVVAYVNTFELWAVLVQSTGPAQAALVPFATLGIGLGLAGWWTVRHRGTLRLSPTLLFAGLTLAVLGLALTDPAFPAKRIHVPQYLLLALVLRRALSDHVGGAVLTAVTIL